MEIITVKRVLLDYYSLMRELQHKEKRKTMKLRVENDIVLKHFFCNVENCFDQDSINEYREAVRNYFTKLQMHPIDHFDVITSIEALQNCLEKLRENLNYPRYFGILNDYKLFS